MSRSCAICGRGALKGKRISHAHNRTNRRWKPNLQTVRVPDGANSRKVVICTSCLKAGKVEKVVS